MVFQLKGNKIIIKTENDIRELQSKIAQIQMQYEAFTIFSLTTIINQEIVDKIHDRMRSNNVSLKVINETFLDSNVLILGNKFFFKIKSTYHDPDTGFAVAVMIEDGREAYTISAPEPTADRPRPHLTPIIDGEQKFLKKADIPVFPAQKNVKETIIRNMDKVQKRINRDTKKFNLIVLSIPLPAVVATYTHETAT